MNLLSSLLYCGSSVFDSLCDSDSDDMYNSNSFAVASWYETIIIVNYKYKLPNTLYHQIRTYKLILIKL